MMRVLVTSCGASPALDVLRSLRLDPSLHLVGGDATAIGRELGGRHADEVLGLPRADRGAREYAEALLEVSRDFDAVFIGIDVECEALAKAGLAPPNAYALPAIDLVPILLDKAATVRAAGLPHLFPETVEADGLAVVDAVASFDGPVWIRPRVGTSGQGACMVSSAEEARSWIGFWRSRGVGDQWMVQSYLPGRNLNWTGLYRGGELIAQASMERLEYHLQHIAVSGVTGQVRRSRTVDPEPLCAIGDLVVRALTDEPSGIFSIDLREDAAGDAKINEINPRMAGRPWLYTNAGVNLPLAVVRAFEDLPLGDAVAPGGLRLGREIYRQLDEAPVFSDARPDGSQEA